MKRKRPYKKWLAVVDVILIFATYGIWMGVVIVRELYMFTSSS